MFRLLKKPLIMTDTMAWIIFSILNSELHTQSLPLAHPLMQYPSIASNITKQTADRDHYFIFAHVIVHNRSSPGFLFYRPCSTRGKVDDSSPPLIFFLPFAHPIHCAKWYIYIGHNLNHHTRRLCWMCRQAFQRWRDADRGIMGAKDRNSCPRHPSNQTTPLQ